MKIRTRLTDEQIKKIADAHAEEDAVVEAACAKRAAVVAKVLGGIEGKELVARKPYAPKSTSLHKLTRDVSSYMGRDGVVGIFVNFGHTGTTVNAREIYVREGVR